MKKTIFEILDESNDKAYFTIIPNYILNHSTGDEQALYSQMKKFAGERGKCFASNKTLAKKLKWGEFKVRSNIKKLLKREWIIKAGTVNGKTRPTNAYKVVDLWKLNTDFYTKKIKADSTVSSKKKKDSGSQHGKITADSTLEEEPNINKNNMLQATFSLFKEIKKLLKDPRRHIQIIGLWIKERELRPENAEQLQSIIKRYCKAARLLNGYSNDDICETIEAIKRTDYISKFTLETIAKFIDEVVAQKKKKGPKIIRWEEVTRPDGNKVMRAIYEEK